MKKYLLVILCCVLICSCTKKYNEDFAVGQNEEINKITEQRQQLDESFAKANTVINLKEKENILGYIERRGWEMQEKNGVYIQITKNGNGKIINDSDIVAVNYDCYLLNGQRYGSTSSQTDTFFVGGDTKIPFGLLSAVKNLRYGTQARVIIPSDVAFAVSEQGEKINQSNTLIYIIEIKDVKVK
ncbi:MAG: FKBP-type peptidyl-prolyl cis-trans isomerase [Bacteroidales bacterium]|nr:FKBP-type peptidyl-prolyl cis-trans isomerase [Bacteroidales bacterium]